MIDMGVKLEISIGDVITIFMMIGYGKKLELEAVVYVV